MVDFLFYLDHSWNFFLKFGQLGVLCLLINDFVSNWSIVKNSRFKNITVYCQSSIVSTLPHIQALLLLLMNTHNGIIEVKFCHWPAIISRICTCVFVILPAASHSQGILTSTIPLLFPVAKYICMVYYHFLTIISNFLYNRLDFPKLVLFIAQQLVHQNHAIWVIWFGLVSGELEHLSWIFVNF